ncbi:MAG: YbaB/EbfC family nucleoid-associated protein [Clostridia bacterium]|nr:YbaB/EbfC family nucleoid-associated protein [Clostridia bacterium]
MAKGKFNMGGGMPANMANLMKQAQKMQESLTIAQEDLASKSYKATSGGGAVSVTLSGTGKLVDLVIDESVLDDAEMVADLVIAAVNQAIDEKDKDKESTLGGLAGGMGNFGGLF